MNVLLGDLAMAEVGFSNPPTPARELVALVTDPVTMLAMARAFKAAHDEHAAARIPKIYAAGQREEANVIVGLRAALEVLTTRAATLPQGVSAPEVRFNPDGSLDEVISDGFHLEKMSPSHWWMQVGPHMVNLHAKGKITAHFGKNEATPPPAELGKGGSLSRSAALGGESPANDEERK